MKTRLFTVALAFIGLNTLAQITVTDTDIISIGDVIYQGIDSLPSNSITIGSSGANQTWDFSNLQQDEVSIIDHVDPSTTAFGFMHPTSNICSQEDGENIYFKKSPTAVEIVGFDDMALLNPILALPLPLTYPMQFSTGPVLAINDKEENTFLPDSLATVMTFGTAHTVDSINVQVTLESSYTIDGWGDVIIPMGTFPSLRLFVSNINTQTVLFYCTDTIFGVNSGWYPAPQQLFPTGTETDYFYQWWSNDPSVKFALLNLDVDVSNNVESATFLTTSQVSSVSSLKNIKVNVYPNPTSRDLIITTNSIKCSYNLLDVKGSKLLSNEFNTTTTIDLSSFYSGTYFLQIYTQEGNVTTKKVVVE